MRILLQHNIFLTSVMSVSLLASVGCDRGRGIGTESFPQNGEVRRNDQAHPLAKALEQVAVSTITSTAQSQPYLTSPQPVLLNATNLAIIHSRLIAVSPSEWTVDEKYKLGEFVSAVGPTGSADKVSYSEGAQMSQDYLWAVRRTAGKTCGKLISDAILVNNGTYTLNGQRTGFAFVTESDWAARKISTEAIQAFMSKVFGYESADKSVLHGGVRELQEIFNESVANVSGAPKDERMHANYIYLCVSVLSDPRTFTR